MLSTIRPQDRDLWFGDTRVSIRVAAEDGADQTCVIEHWMPFGEAPPLHAHLNEDEIFHVLEGAMHFSLEGAERVARPGETIFIPKGARHGFRVISPAGARCLTVTRGHDFIGLVRAASRPAEGPGLPAYVGATPERVARLGRLCAEHSIDIVGAPLAA